MIASGPTREYIFLSNQLQRATTAGGERTDKDVVVDVWLQSAGEGVSQDTNTLLTAFPSQPHKMFECDCLLAFAPCWTWPNSRAPDVRQRNVTCREA